MTVTTTEAYEGDYSLRIEANGLNDPETVGISERVPVDGPMLVAFRVKHEGNAAEDSIGYGNNNLGLRMIGYDQEVAGVNGYDGKGGVDLPMNGKFKSEFADTFVPLLANAATGKTAGADWTQYAFVWYPQPESIAMEVRLSYWHEFTGVSYWDDVFIAPVSAVVEALESVNLLSDGGLESAMPTFWSPSGDGAEWSSRAFPNA